MGQGVGPQGPRELEGRPMESQEVKGQASIVYYDLFHLFFSLWLLFGPPQNVFGPSAM